MGKLVHDDVLNAALAVIATATKANVCLASANTFARATTTQASASGYQLASVTLDASNYSTSSGSSTGRKITCLVSDSSDMKSISVNASIASQSAAEIALTLAAGSKLFYVTTLASTKSLNTGDKVTLGSFDVTIADPT